MRSILLLPLLTASVLACGSAAALQSRPVAPGQPFNGPVIDVRAPRSSGWLFLWDEKGPKGFAKNGTDKIESYAAQVTWFELPHASTPDDMVALIKTGVASDTSNTRFKILKEQFDYTDARGYPCVRFRSEVVDSYAQTGLFSHKVVYLQTSALYCRHPRNPDIGFVATYSHRGTKQVDIEADAESFIADVQVPPPIKPAEAASAPASATSN